MKKIVREYQFTPEQQARVRELARILGITRTTAGILFARGMDTEEKMRRFLAPSRENFLSPELMQGIAEARQLLLQAKREDWRVAVFGDYDADGIGACAILFRALRLFGIEPYLYIPERCEGYGMSIAAIDRIFDDFLPDLIVTVDCGISNAAEVEYIKELGAQVIVTDHHELPEVLPDCICINPKLKDAYPYDNLCGAGVALKLSVALIGERAYDLLDFCALSTVADSVPLLGENRDIVAEGLKQIAKNPRPAFAALLGKKDEITAQTLAFTIAPRINAAGRMGDARSALRLFTTEDLSEISVLAEKLDSYNSERQKLCDSLYESARDQILREGAYGNVITVIGENWSPGLIGIVAARIAEEFSRPAILFVKKGEMLRGSARSIESVNIYEALRHCSEWIEEFGGHAQAAGINLRTDRFEQFRAELDAYIGTRYTREDLTPSLCISEEIEGELPRGLAEELSALEPFGIGNRRPLFAVRGGKLDACVLKPQSPHVSFCLGGFDFMYFWGGKDLRLLRSDAEKQIVFECMLSKFRGKVTCKGYVRSVVYDGRSGTDAVIGSVLNAVQSLRSDGGSPQAEYSDSASLNEFIASRTSSCLYGLCAIAYHRETLDAFPALDGIPVELFGLSSGSVCNAVLIAPSPGCDLSAYREIVFLEVPPTVAIRTGKAKVYINRELCGYRHLRELSLSRETLLEIYAALRLERGGLAGTDFAEVSRNGFAGFSPEQTVFALSVFEELGLIRCTEGRIRPVTGRHTRLELSRIYSGVQALQERN